VRIFGNFSLTRWQAVVSIDSTVILELTSMTDPKLDEEINLLKKCMDALKRFHDIFDNAVLTETVVPDDEGKLQELRQSLPQKWDSLFQSLGLKRDDSVRSLVDAASSLSAVNLFTDYQKRKLYDLWHKTFMRLHFLLGKLQYRKERLQALPAGRLRAKKFFASPLFVVLVVVVLVLLYILLRQASA
jgi:hypothetical protein